MSRFGLILGLFAAIACSETAIAQQSFATDSKQAFAPGNIFAPLPRPRPLCSRRRSLAPTRIAGCCRHPPRRQKSGVVAQKPA